MVGIISEGPRLGAKILVAGIGGCGGNAVNRMIDEDIHGVDFIAMNTDVQALNVNKAPRTLQLGERVTKGLGAGAQPQIGERAAEESMDEIRSLVEPYDMVFVTCGMGGGTGTGAAPVVARIAKELGKLTVGVVTKPFFYEGSRRMQNAAIGIEKIRPCVDTLIVIPNDKIYEIMDAKMDYTEGLRKADEVLQQSVAGITELINTPAEINLDFADVQTAMRDKGVAHIGIGVGKGEARALDAVKMAVESPLLETTIQGATDLIVHISGDVDMQGPRDAMQYIIGITGPEPNIILGCKSDKTNPGECKITLIATGIEESKRNQFSVNRSGVPSFKTQQRTPLSAGLGSSYGASPSANTADGYSFRNKSLTSGMATTRPANTSEAAAQVKRDMPRVDIKRGVETGTLNIPSFLKK